MILFVLLTEIFSHNNLLTEFFSDCPKLLVYASKLVPNFCKGTILFRPAMKKVVSFIQSSNINSDFFVLFLKKPALEQCFKTGF